MFNKLKQIKDLRSQAKNMQTELAKELIIGSALGGKIIIKLDGNQQVQEVAIDPSLLANEQKDTLENGIKDAFANAHKELQKIMAEKLRNGNLNLPDFNF